MKISEKYEAVIAVRCPQCGAEPGAMCKVISGKLADQRPGDLREEPHFYRG